MATIMFSADEKLGLLLHLLGEKAVAGGLKGIPSARADSIKRYVSELASDPPSSDEIQFVLDDFEKYFRFAINTLGTFKKRESGKKNPSGGDSGPPGPTIISFQAISSGQDLSADLAKLDAWQVATALSADQPKTVAIVLSQMSADAAGRVLALLPEELRSSSFLHMSSPHNLPRPILERLLRTTFEKANQIRERRNEVDHTDKIVSLMRSLPKAVRKQLMDQLSANDEKFATAVREKMYRFDDILRLDDRGIQAVLSKIASEQLVMSLTRADEQIVTRVLGNMSKRARQTIEEEISFNEKATDQEVEFSRGEVAQVLGRMDEAGEVSL